MQPRIDSKDIENQGYASLKLPSLSNLALYCFIIFTSESSDVKSKVEKE